MVIKAWADKLLPKTLSEWLFCVGGLMFLTAFAVRHLTSVDPLEPGTFQGTWWFVIGICDVSGLGLVTSTPIVSGLRSIRRAGPTLARVSCVLAGLAACIALAAESAFMSSLLVRSNTEFDAILGPEMLVKLESALDRPDLSLAKRAALSKLYAQETYFQKGDLIDYVGPDGGTVRFQPTADEIRSHRLRLVAPVLIGNAAAHLGRGPVLWVTVSIVSCAVGLLTPVRGRSVQDER